jgi:hypothetical protein
MNNYLIITVLACVSGILWRMGGSDDYEKIWRRAGSFLCMVCLLPFGGNYVAYVVACALILWGCVSYFGWFNYIVRLLWDDIEMDREYLWNFFLEDTVIQMSIFVIKPNPISALFAVVAAIISSTGKVLIDKHLKDGIYINERINWNQAVVSEFWHGSSNAFFIGINSII